MINKILFENLLGLWSLLILIPFIILYLIRPKPKDKVIPSLMFLIKEKRNINQSAFFRNLIRNFLFFLQLIILFLLAISIAKPYFIKEFDVASKNTIIVLDSSASMLTSYKGKSRFEKAIEIAKDNLKGDISIILAADVPRIILDKGNKKKALEILNSIKPLHTTTDIGDALLLAQDLLENEKGKIIVLSDFVQTHGSDPLVVRKAITSKGNEVEFINLGGEVKNVGIIDVDLTKYDAMVYIKNFNKNQENVKLELVSNGKVVEKKELTLDPNSIEGVKFSLPKGISKINLKLNDDFYVDNTLYISSPLKRKVDVLLITNSEGTNLEVALFSSKDVNLVVAKPPVLPEFNKYDIVILHQFNRELILPGTFQDLKRYIENGGKLIITAQEDIDKVSMLDLSPVEFFGVSNKTLICFNVINQYTKQFENNRCPAITSRHFKVKAKNGTITIATSQDNTPLIVSSESVIYYGIFDNESEFRTLTSYPIFWNDLINFLSETGDISEYNFKTGEVITNRKGKIKTPSNIINTNRFIFDITGIYEFDGKKVAVNLVSEAESNVGKESKIIEDYKKTFFEDKIRKEKRVNVDIALIFIAIILLLLELLIIKFRGEV